MYVFQISLTLPKNWLELIINISQESWIISLPIKRSTPVTWKKWRLKQILHFRNSFSFSVKNSKIIYSSSEYSQALKTAMYIVTNSLSMLNRAMFSICYLNLSLNACSSSIIVLLLSILFLFCGSLIWIIKIWIQYII